MQPVPEEIDFSTLRSILAIQGGELLISVLREMIQGTVRFDLYRLLRDTVYLIERGAGCGTTSTGPLQCPARTDDYSGRRSHSVLDDDFARHSVQA